MLCYVTEGRYRYSVMITAGCQLDFVKKKKKVFNARKKFFFLLHAYLNKNSKG